MPQTIYELLDDLDEAALDDRDKGSKLELLMRKYLKTDPVYAEQFDDVWLWMDWPGRKGRMDTGVDLVATNRVTGGLVAIQCKFYSPKTAVSKPTIDSFLATSGKVGFSERIIVSTTDKWNSNAEDAIKDQAIPVRRISVSDLEASPVDWAQFSFAEPESLVTTPKKRLRKHQKLAISEVTSRFETSDRGKLIMACGTGKTFTALRLSEQMVGPGGSVLLLVPSISLLSQSLREWVVEAEIPLSPLAVCSDRQAARKAKRTDEDTSIVDLALPATTNVAVFESRLTQSLGESDSMTVVFGTYQSIDVISQAQKQGELPPFDLIVCDEAHRTTGTTLAGQDESAFVRVHRQDYIAGRKRLYMTATPRIYDDSSKAKAGEVDAVLASMDVEETYGPEFHRLGFGEAVSQDLLVDYKVLVLAVYETAIASTFQTQLAEQSELNLDDAAKIVGCWNGLAKVGGAEHDFLADPAPMRRAVAFAGTIRDSIKIRDLFSSISGHYAEARDLTDGGRPLLQCEVHHVDGSFNSLARDKELDWLRGNVGMGECRIVTNARCLSEGVDVPALDAVMFLSPRKSTVDIVQSVGRVMRKDPEGEKKFGYIILPIGIPHGVAPEQALRDNRKYAVVWEVLQALRAHDEHFEAKVNRIDLTSSRDDSLNVIGVPGPDDRTGEEQGILPLTFALDEWRDAIYAKIVAKVGSRRYWQDWASDVADIAKAHVTRITALLDVGGDDKVSDEFALFLDGLKANLNNGITRDDAVEMLAQHLITRPVFEALFSGYDFAAENPVAQTMDRMLAALDEHSLDDENQTLEKFYDSVRMRVQGIDNAEGRQKIIVELYNNFFATAFKRTVDKLGIVYTPVEIVDFILRSADWALRHHFNRGLTDEGVHVLDGFVGTGTFIVRLIQSGLISSHDLARKYAEEMHANEILLLAYYIAAINIETAFHDSSTEVGVSSGYEPFQGLVLTDTFQSYEEGDTGDRHMFVVNDDRIDRQRRLPITVIVGNPPYSAGQDSANDNNQNEQYSTLDDSIRQSYAARSSAVLKKSLYDSYIRAIRWATLRINDRGVVAFVTNNGFLDSNTADGMRQVLSEDFSSIYIFNLRGNQRTTGQQSQREGGKVFGAGSRAGVTITLLVRDLGDGGPGTIHYAEVADNMSRLDKLKAVEGAGSIAHIETRKILPNESGDWARQRSAAFDAFREMGNKKDSSSAIFDMYTTGIKSNRDAWVYNYSRAVVEDRVRATIKFYNAQVSTFKSRKAPRSTDKIDDFISLDPTKFSWDRTPRSDVARGRYYTFRPTGIRRAAYRPFTKCWVYFDRQLNNTIYQIPKTHPTEGAVNFGIELTGTASHHDFSVLMVDKVPDVHTLDTGQFFPRWTYKSSSKAPDLFADPHAETGDFERQDNVTDATLERFVTAYDESFTKDDIFFYVYGLLHSPEYRDAYAADLKKMLPRLPLVEDPWPFIDAGRRLGDLHLNYESVVPFALSGLDGGPGGVTDEAYEYFRVDKMRWPSRGDRSGIVFNSRIRLGGIPEDAYRYQLGSRSAIEWIVDRYQVKVDNASKIKNDPNDWSREVGNPRYIVDLFARVVTVSLETMEVVDGLPPLDVRDM